MADTKISALTAAGALGGAEAVPAVQSGGNVKISATQFGDLTAGRFHPGLTSATWYGPAATITTFGTGVAADFLYLVPIFVPYACTITDLGIYVVTGAGNAKFGLYSNVAGVPTTLLGSTSLVSTASSTADASGTLTVAVSVGAGMCWAAILFSGTPTVAQYGTDGMAAFLIGGDTVSHVVKAGGPIICCWHGSGGYTAGMQATVGSPARQYGAAPAIAFKVQ